MKGRAAVVGIGVALLIGLIVWLRPPGDDPGGPADMRERARAAPDEPSDPTSGSVDSSVAPLPKSLSGTREDGALVVDRNGRFVPTTDALDLFDYYLTATGEESDEDIYARIVAAIEARLDGDNAIEARALFDNYLRYRVRAGELLVGPLIGEDPARRLQYLRELRREVFGREHALALFGEEEARWFADLERQRIMLDESLEQGEREQRLVALDAEESPAIAAARQASLAHRTLREEEARLRDTGADAVAIAQLREERVGPEAAKRLGDLDAERERWQHRLASYRADRDQRLAHVSTEQRASLLEHVRAEHFAGGELLRVRALDRVEQGGDFN